MLPSHDKLGEEKPRVPKRKNKKNELLVAP